MNIVGIGLDLVEISRIREVIERHGARFVEKVYTAGEAEYCRSLKSPWASFAGRWAAKEAVMKAFGPECRKIWWPRHVEVTRDSSGKPGVRLHGPGLEAAERMKVRRVELSISHTDDVAAANAILLAD